MLRDAPIRPKDGDLPRRWMSDDYFDLIVWYQPDGPLHGFQLCYDKPIAEHALTWTAGEGFRHSAIDPGEELPTDQRNPMLIKAMQLFPAARVITEFRQRSTRLSPVIRQMVLSRLREFSDTV